MGFALPNALPTIAARVDFPMPGSPDNKTRDPATTPPPRTRSSSPMVVALRSADLRSALSSLTTSAAFASATAEALPPVSPPLSLNVPQPPHSRHRPLHLSCCASHFEHVNIGSRNSFIADKREDQTRPPQS